MPEVTVATLGRIEHAFTYGWDADGEFEVPWDERPRVTLDVADQEALGRILQRAGDAFGVRLPPDYHEPTIGDAVAFVNFFQPGEHERFVGPLRHSLTLVDEDGRVYWNVWPWKDRAYRDVQRAKDAGVLPGDPSRMYLVLAPPMGNGAALDWATLLDALDVAWKAIEAMGAVGGALAFSERVRNAVIGKIRTSRKTVDEKNADWSERGGRPWDLEELLGRGPWHEADLAQRLACSPPQAEAILWAHGYKRGPSGLWLKGDEPERWLAAEVQEEIRTTFAIAHDGPEFEPLLRDRLDHLLRTGERLAAPWELEDPLDG